MEMYNYLSDAQLDSNCQKSSQETQPKNANEKRLEELSKIYSDEALYCFRKLGAY